MGWHRGELALRAATEETAGTRGVEEVKEVMQAAANHEARSESLALVVVARVEQARRWRLEADTGTHCSKRYLTVTVACHPRQQQTPGGCLHHVETERNPGKVRVRLVGGPGCG